MIWLSKHSQLAIYHIKLRRNKSRNYQVQTQQQEFDLIEESKGVKKSQTLEHTEDLSLNRLGKETNFNTWCWKNHVEE